MDFINKIIDRFRLDTILNRNVKVSSFRNDFGIFFYFAFVILPIFTGVAGLVGDYLVVDSIIVNAELNYLAYFGGGFVALAIQGVLYQAPSGVGKNIRFVFNYLKLTKGRKDANYKRPLKHLFFAVAFGAVSFFALQFSLGLNDKSEGIVMRIIDNDNKDTVKTGTHNELIKIQSQMTGAISSANKNYNDALSIALTAYNEAIKANAKANLCKTKAEQAERNGKHDFAAKMRKEMKSYVMTEYNDYINAKDAAKKIKDNAVSIATAITSTGIEEVTGNKTEKEDFKKKSKEMLLDLLKNFLRYANWYTCLSGLVLGFIAKDLKENEDNEIDLTTLDYEMTKK